MDQLFNGMYFTFFTVNNILVFSNTVKQHMQHLESVFDILKGHGLVLDVDNCRIGVHKVNSFGQQCSVEGIVPSLISDEPVVLDNGNCATNDNFLANSNQNADLTAECDGFESIDAAIDQQEPLTLHSSLLPWDVGRKDQESTFRNFTRQWKARFKNKRCCFVILCSYFSNNFNKQLSTFGYTSIESVTHFYRTKPPYLRTFN